MKAPVMKYGYSGALGRWVTFERDSVKMGDPAHAHQVRAEHRTADEAAKWVRGYLHGYRYGEAKPGPWSTGELSAYSDGYETGVGDYCRDLDDNT